MCMKIFLKKIPESFTSIYLSIYLLWGHILSYPEDVLVQPKHILQANSLGGDNFSFLTRHLTDGLQAEHG